MIKLIHSQNRRDRIPIDRYNVLIKVKVDRIMDHEKELKLCYWNRQLDKPESYNTILFGNTLNSSAVTTQSQLDNDDIIYMVLTDRFYDGDSTNNGTLNAEYRPGELKYTQGGDWQGIIDKMQYCLHINHG
jgi:hypothetical protein